MGVGLEQLALGVSWPACEISARLAEQLIASLEEDEVPDVDDVAIETAKRRAEELAEGKVQGIPAEDVMRRAGASEMTPAVYHAEAETELNEAADRYESRQQRLGERFSDAVGCCDK